jgi:ferredoxin
VILEIGQLTLEIEQEMSVLDEFAHCFGVWKEARPYLHLMVDEQEMQLVVAMGSSAVTPDEAAGFLKIPRELATNLLERCYARSLVDKVVEPDVNAYSAGSFYAFLDYFAKFENWDEIPPEGRRRIDRRFLDEFIAKHRSSVERKMEGLEAQNALPNDTVLLLSEAEEMIDAATYIVVQPCDCRRLGQNCDRPVETCVWLDESALQALDRGHGRHLTKQEAKELLRWADRKGLMHTGDSEWQTRGLHAICNCCSCDCYPFRAAQELGSKGIWPRSRYVAVHDREQCNLCGACVKRCHFDAFYHDGSVAVAEGQEKQNVLFEPKRCWGCGLCATTCPSGAISMGSWP